MICRIRSGRSCPPLLLHPVDATSPSISNKSACTKSRIVDSKSSGSAVMGEMSVRTTMRGLSGAARAVAGSARDSAMASVQFRWLAGMFVPFCDCPFCRSLFRASHPHTNRRHAHDRKGRAVIDGAHATRITFGASTFFLNFRENSRHPKAREALRQFPPISSLVEAQKIGRLKPHFAQLFRRVRRHANGVSEFALDSRRIATGFAGSREKDSANGGNVCAL